MILLVKCAAWKKKRSKLVIVAVDNTVLSFFLHPNSQPPLDPNTGKLVTHCVQRVEAVIDDHSKRGDTILIPTPSLSELLCVVPDLEKAISEIDCSVAFEIAPFDVRAAIDLATEIRRSIRSGDKRAGVAANWQEIKFDRQIAAIAKVNGAELLYTDDENQTTFAERVGRRVGEVVAEPLPPQSRTCGHYRIRFLA